MKLSISNIAWSKENDNIIFDNMKKFKFHGLEIAPTRIFNDPYSERYINVLDFKKIINSLGFELVSMQSLIFNRPDLVLFGDIHKREELKKYLYKAIDFANILGIKNLVFGSPKNRDGFNKNKDYNIAIDFFNKLGNYAILKKTTISLEPNPKKYGTNFINSTSEAYNFIMDVDNDGVKLQIDTGTMFINNESPGLIYNYFEKINHVHFSEDNLDCINKLNKDYYKEVIRILNDCGYDNYISIEMKKTDIKK